MRKEVIVSIFLFLILVMLIVPVSAGLFSDFWNKITGGATAPDSTIICPQSQCSLTSPIYCISNTIYQYCKRIDSTTYTGDAVIPVGCEWNAWEIGNCAPGLVCSNGTCINLSLIPTCYDSDGNGAWQTKGYVKLVYPNGTIQTATDYCEGLKTIDYYCQGTYTGSPPTLIDMKIGKGGYIPTGCTCQDGACVSSTNQTNCTDTCTTFNYSCGQKYICGVATNCGTCSGGLICNSIGKCVFPGQLCGNRALDPGEDCDDGNIVSGDGCSLICSLEAGYWCFGTPSVCVNSCSSYCATEGYFNSSCLSSAGACVSSGGVHGSLGDQFCTGLYANTCCCASQTNATCQNAIVYQEETLKLNLGGENYNLFIEYIDPIKVVLNVNNYQTVTISSGGSVVLTDETYIKVNQISYDSTGINPNKVYITIGLNKEACLDGESVLQYYNLSVSKRGEGIVISSPSGIDCGTDCSEIYVNGTIVTLTAQPLNVNEQVGTWYRCDQITPDKKCIVNMNSNKQVKATFTCGLACLFKKIFPIRQ
ncbi:MAG: hypothetical protein ABIH65_02225 [Nanoarchaeota archaeon]